MVAAATATVGRGKRASELSTQWSIALRRRELGLSMGLNQDLPGTQPRKFPWVQQSRPRKGPAIRQPHASVLPTIAESTLGNASPQFMHQAPMRDITELQASL